MISWDRPPIFLDFETQSAADLPAIGGRLYAEHPTTRVLSCVVLIDGVFHVWIPDYISKAPVDMRDLWLSAWGPPPAIHLHRTPIFPPELIHPDRTYVAHNAFNFDKFIMERVCRVTDLYWADTLYLARIAGLPGSLDGLSKFLGTGRKDEAKSLLDKLTTATVEHRNNDLEFVYPPAPIGTLTVILRYNLQDVRLLEMAWERFADLKVEVDVIEAHEAANERGVKLDTELVRKIQLVGSQSLERSVKELEEITKGQMTILDKETKKKRQQLKARNKSRLKSGKEVIPLPPGPRCIRSTEQVLEWLNEQGLKIVDPVTKKQTLRREVVEQHLANPWMMIDDVSDMIFEAVQNIDPAVFQVLRLRGQALRITSAKLDKAVKRVGRDGRIRDLITYHVAATGRNSSQGVQVHNLPRPKKGVDVNGLLNAYWTGEWTDQNGYDLCKSFLNGEYLVVDDALSALIRPCLIPEPDNLFGIADYAQIEARCVGWLAGEEGLLDLFRHDAGVYEDMAAKIYGIPRDQVAENQRQVGKTVILGAGYGMSATKFAIYAGLQGINLEKAGTTADVCIEAFRQAYPKIAGFPTGKVFNGKQVRAGGLWQQADRAAKDALHGGLHVAGRCKFLKVGLDLIVVLPSGRELRYHNARIEDRVPAYASLFGLELTPKPTIVYDSPRGERSTYGAKLCLGADTRVVTSLGLRCIIDVKDGDWVWDGEHWVQTQGCTYQGHKEVGTCLGLSLTGDHLISDGNSWRSAIQSDERFLSQALGWARSSMTSPLFSQHREPNDGSGHVTPLRTITGVDELRNRLWKGTRTADVYDLLNCGPNRRFTVMTDCGPLIVHNCENISQATARDVMASAKVGAHWSNLGVILDVHDELVIEDHRDRIIESLMELAEIMKAGTPWSEGFPIGIEAYVAPAYIKKKLDKSWFATH